MIIRTNIACKTCGHVHTARIGMGNDTRQMHRFKCSGCSENISIGLSVNFQDVSCEPIFEENVEPAGKEGTIVNLDAAFPVNPDSTGNDHVRNRVKQLHRLVTENQRRYDEVHGKGAFADLIGVQEGPSIGLHDEWQRLKQVWSLSRNGKASLAKKKMKDAFKEIYPNDAPDHLYDWLWRFCGKIGGAEYEQRFMKILLEIKRSTEGGVKFDRFFTYFKKSLQKQHLNVFFEIFRQYFEHNDAFIQVQSYCRAGLSLPRGFSVGSNDFDDVKMFYGNAFEGMTTLVEFLACLNNAMAGREYDEFKTMTLSQYKEIDKAGRCNPFADNAAFFSICDCLDNQIRNASHHGNFKLSPNGKRIEYRSGKSGKGKKRHMSYTKYIHLCNKIFLSITVLFRLELILMANLGKPIY
jgi:hypothetical protein